MMRLSTLPSGLRVLTDSQMTANTVAVGFWVGVGTRHEDEGETGIAHVFEHMLFKGTPKRSALAISTDMENVGGNINAYTSREQTAYFARVLKEDAKLAIDVLADMLQNSLFPEDELDKERQVIIQEIHQTKDTPDDIIIDYWHEAAFPGQTLGRSILGNEQIISKIKRQDLVRYQQHYALNNMIVAASGAIEHDAFCELAAEYFLNIPQHHAVRPGAAMYRGGRRLENRQLEQTHIIIGFQGVPASDPRFHALSLYTTLLGGGMSSRLFQEIREKRGLVYAIQASTASYADGGLVGAYAATNPGLIPQLLPLMAEVWKESAVNPVQEELDRAKAQLRAGLLMSLESTSQRLEQLAHYYLTYGRIVEPEENLAQLMDVTLDDVHQIAQQILKSPITIAAVGPTDEVEKWEGFGL
ncbi:MAG: M16 family metallopeptidase [Dongiaceae bacterium]